MLSEFGDSLQKHLRPFVSSAEPLRAAEVKSFINHITFTLIKADVDVRVVKGLQVKLLNEFDKTKDLSFNHRKHIHKLFVNEMLSMLGESTTKRWHPPKKTAGGPKSKRKVQAAPTVVLFVGMQGAGKTTTVAKYARYYKRKGCSPAMIAADTFRAGAVAQLAQNAARVPAPFYSGGADVKDPVVVVEKGFQHFRSDSKINLVLVDTAGRNKEDKSLISEMKKLFAAAQPDHVVYVADGSQGQALRAQMEAFSAAIRIDSVIVTKLDGGAKGGGALTAVCTFGKPILFIGNGEHLEDLQIFEPKAFLNRLLGGGDLEGLSDLIDRAGFTQDNEVKDQDNYMLTRLREKRGFLTLGDAKRQLAQIWQLGPLAKTLDLVPGVKVADTNSNSAERRAKQFLTMTDSMTPNELEGDEKQFLAEPSRIARVRRGSGLTSEHLTEALDMYKIMKKSMKKLAIANPDL